MKKNLIDDRSLPALDELKTRSDVDIVKAWLRDRGFVAVDRELMEEMVGFCGVSCGAVYHADGDYYIKRET